MTIPRLLRQPLAPIPGSGPEPGLPGQVLRRGPEVPTRLAGRRLPICGRRTRLLREAEPGSHDDEHATSLLATRSDSRTSSSIPRIPEPTPSGVGFRGSGTTGQKLLRRPTERGPRTRCPTPACRSRALQPPGVSSQSMDNRLESTNDELEAASAADGTEFTEARSVSTDEERDSFGMTAPIPWRTCPTPSGGRRRLDGHDVRRRFAGRGQRVHGCVIRFHGREAGRQLAGRRLRVHG